MIVEKSGAERRRHQRKVKPFYAAFSADGKTYLPAYGIDISEGGVGILSPTLPPDGKFKLRMMIEKRDFIVTVARRRVTEQLRDGKTWYATGAQFVTVHASDQTFVTEFVESLQIPQASALLSKLESEFGGPVVDTPGDPNNREAKRKRKPFYIAFSLNGTHYLPGYGLDISRTGMRLFTDAQMPADQVFKVRVILREREFMIAAKKSWDKFAAHGTKTGWVTGTLFTQIDAIDREFIECYVDEKPFFAGNKLLEALERLRLEPDRADLWLPPELLTSFLEKLVELNRLAPLSGPGFPLIRYHYEGKRTRGQHVRHIVHVESRLRGHDGIKHFNTRFSFDEAGANLRVV